MNYRKLIFCILANSLIMFIAVSLTLAYDGDGIVEPGEDKAEDLRRAAQNPMAKMISFPIQNNTNFKFGPLEKTQNVTNIQPVVPFNLGEDWLLISRTIAPLIYQPELVEGQGSEFGLGDISQALFIGPSNPGRFIWGAAGLSSCSPLRRTRGWELESGAPDRPVWD